VTDRLADDPARHAPRPAAKLEKFLRNVV